MQDLASALSRCPFLHKVSAQQGEGFALQIALNPFKPASRGQPCPVVLEEGSLGSLEATVKLFHGPGGIVPLKRFAEAAPAPQATGCPFHRQPAAQQTAPSPSLELAPAESPAAPAAPARPFGSMPMASMSLSAFGFMVRGHGSCPAGSQLPQGCCCAAAQAAGSCSVQPELVSCF